MESPHTTVSLLKTYVDRVRTEEMWEQVIMNPNIPEEKCHPQNRMCPIRRQVLCVMNPHGTMGCRTFRRDRS